MKQAFLKQSIKGAKCAFTLFIAMLLMTFYISCAFPCQAHAATAAEKRAEADEVYTQIDSLQTSLNETMAIKQDAESAYAEATQLAEEASTQIEEETQHLEQLQSSLSDFAVGMYKESNSGSFLEVLLQTTSFEQFLISWDFCTSVSEKGFSLIKESQDARQTLENAKASYEEQSNRAAAQMEIAQQALDQIQSTQDALRSQAQSLSAEADELQVQEELAAEAARQAEEARIQREAELASNTYNISYSAGESVLMGSGYFTNPCPLATLSSDFGYRSFDSSFHKGADLAAAEGTPYYAADSGTVLYATNDGGYNGGAGNWVVISHGNGIVTKYMHSLTTFVSPGDYVERGQNIGLVGNTGDSYGAHLHFQVEVGGVAVNPLLYI